MSIAKCFLDLDTALLKVTASVEKLFKNKKLPKEFKEAVGIVLDSYKETVNVKNVADLTEEYLDMLDINMRQEVLNLINTARALDENKTFVKSLLDLGFETRQGVVEKLNQIFGRTQNAVQGEVRWYNKTIEDGFDQLYIRGDMDELTIKSAKKTFLSHIGGGNGLIRIFADKGIESVDKMQNIIWKALKQGHYKGIPELHAIAKVMRDMDDVVVARVQGNGVPFKSLKNHIVRIAENRQRVVDFGLDQFKQLGREVFDFKEIFGRKGKSNFLDKDIDTWLEQRFDRKTEKDAYGLPRKKKTNLGHSREAIFISDEAELQYYAATALESNDILRAAFSHRQNILKNSKLYEYHGSNLGMAVENISRHILEDDKTRKVLGDDRVRFVESEVKTAAEDVGILRSGSADVSETASAWYKIIGNYASAVQTGFAALRQVMFDGPVHGAFQAANLKSTSALGEWATAWGRQIKAMTQVNKTKELGAMLEDTGLAINISTNYLTQGIINSEKAFRASKFERISHSLAEWNGRLTLSDWVFKSQRVAQSQHVSSILERAFQEGLDSADPIIKRMFVEAGITKPIFEQLQKIDRLKYDGSIVGLDFKKAKVGELDAFQSDKQNLSRARDAYTNLHSRMLNDLVATRTLRGRVGGALRLKHPMERLIYKYWGITLDQYRSWLRLTRAASGLDPDSGDLVGLAGLTRTGTGAFKLGQFMTAAPASGLMYMWTRDLLEGREPSDVTPYTLFQAMTFTGMGGVAALFTQDILYNQDAIGSPLGMVAEQGQRVFRTATSKKGNVGGAVGKAAKRLIPGTNMWFTSAAYDKLLYDGLNVKRSRYEKKRDKERGNEYFILD